MISRHKSKAFVLESFPIQDVPESPKIKASLNAFFESKALLRQLAVAITGPKIDHLPRKDRVYENLL